MRVISTSNEKDSDKYIHGRYLNFQWLGIENWETTANSNKIVTLLHKQNKYKLTLIPIGVSRSSTRAESFWSTISCIHTSLSRLTFLPAYVTSDEEIHITSCQMVKNEICNKAMMHCRLHPQHPLYDGLFGTCHHLRHDASNTMQQGTFICTRQWCNAPTQVRYISQSCQRRTESWT